MCWLLIAFSFSASTAGAVDLQEPLTLQSKKGVLDILLVAKAAAIPSLSPLNPTGWVYDICLNPHNGANDCPATSGSANLYGGTRLQLSQGDTLKIHLVNKLPPITDSDHAQDPDEAFLALNPTNIHTHGLIVSPHYPSKSDPTYGDNVFVLTFNSANGTPVVSPHIHGVVAFNSTDYSIKIPAHHPSGLYWFHPHAHGIALNQVTAGMAGIITIGNTKDYLCNDAGCATFSKTIGVRHMILKDTQVLADGTLKDQEDPDFCLPTSEISPAGPLGQGYCPGQDHSGGDEGGNYTGGRWFFTINGQQFPNIPMTAAGGEIWRITNASASITYDLRLWNPAPTAGHDRSGAFDRWRWHQSRSRTFIAGDGADHWQQSESAALSGRHRSIRQQIWRSTALYQTPSHDAKHESGNQSRLSRCHGGLDYAATWRASNLSHRWIRHWT